MKKLAIALLAISLLLPTGIAQAYAIYNHVDHEVCIQTFWSSAYENCKFLIPAHGKHNGGHGDSLSHVTAVYLVKHGKKCCRCNKEGFSIPKGGYARIYPDEVNVYEHNGQFLERKDITYCDCECEENAGKK